VDRTTWVETDMNFIAAGLSDVGLQREVNEDSYCILPEDSLFLVADGMGGHAAGDVASKMATHTVRQFFKEHSASEDSTWPFHFDPHLSIEENRLSTGIKLANRKICDSSIRHREVQGMGTTLVGILYSEERGKVYIANVGDSRAYRVRKGEIEQLTRDHSLVNDYMLVMPEMTEEQRLGLPKNVITRALGMQDSVAVDLLNHEPEPGDCYVLCSDGLTGMVTDDGILKIIEDSKTDAEKAAYELVRTANENGGEDNVTVVVVFFSQA
jgi:serine/threonine protein phosphatase PrpC